MSKQLLFEALSKIDENVLSAEVRMTISEAFDSALELKSKAKVEELQESVVIALEDNLKTVVDAHVYDLKKQLDESALNIATEMNEAFEKELTESLQAQFDLKVKVLTESVELILTQAVNEAIESYTPALADAVELAKAKKINEAAVEFATKFSIALQEAEKDEEEKTELELEKEKAKKLEDENKEMKKDKIVTEAFVDLSTNQAEKAKKLLESIPFEDSESYTLKVNAIKAIISESKVEPKQLQESTKKASWNR